MEVANDSFTIYEFDRMQRIHHLYEGRAGRKIAVLDDDEVWIVKFPQNTRFSETIEVPYTTSPLSEYIGSQIYAALGFPVHKTRLGIYEGIVVVGCKDFTWNKDYAQFVPAEALLNSISDEKLLYIRLQPSERRYHNNLLEDWLTGFEESDLSREYPEIEERFWDMMVVDAWISNSDRHGGNWSFFIHADNTMELAPIYDNGNSFWAKSSDSTLATILNDATRYHSILHNGQAPYKYQGHRVDLLVQIKNCYKKKYPWSEKLQKSMEKIIPRIHLQETLQMIEEIPSHYHDVEIISPARKRFYQQILADRYEKILLPALEKLAK